MNSTRERSKDGWEVTHRTQVSYDGVPLPPAIVERAAALAAVPAGEHLLASGDDGRVVERLVAAIDAAKRVVVAGAFLFSASAIERALLAASQRGVRVYLLVASEHRLLGEPRADSEFDQRMFEEHKRMLDRLAGWVYVRTAEDWHAKAVLIDDGEAGAGFLLTANLTTEALTRNEELLVVLDADERAQLREIVRWVLWGAAQHEVLVPGKLESVAALPGLSVPSPRGSLVATLRERGSLHEAMLEVVASARREIIVSSFGWDAAHPVVQALCEQARTGCRVTVLARERGASVPALLELRRAGAQVLMFRWLHAKAIWTDGGRGVVASANIEPQGLDRGIEIGVVLDGTRAQELRDVLRGWAARATRELRADATLGDVAGKAWLWRGERIVEVDVPATAAIARGRVVAASADDLSAPALPAPDLTRLPEPLAHAHVVSQVVTAPALDKTAQRIDEAGDEAWPAPFRERGGRVVIAVVTVDQLDAARAMASAHGGAPIVVARGRA
ncbi:MAG: phosphatidylserine/phosphatidylglycerophosphate/cardiolipin synthase family protein [Myxococcales bacterium]|nr:phosphatidylserine/phosphatidylglycerophosphate/cardiolipin synthase family protein [Myxococcales bacterium]